MPKHVHRPLLAACAFALIASNATAQTAPPPPVSSMNCEQMLAEMSTAGQQMNAQLDPEFAREAQAMNDQAQNARSGLGGATRQNGAAQAEANRARMGAQSDRLNNAMAGLDQQRLVELAQRFEEQRCPTPQ